MTNSSPNEEKKPDENSKIEFVLDASALLALFFEEPGGEAVRALAPRSAIGAINYFEVLAKMARRSGDVQGAARTLGQLDMPVIPFDRAIADEGADLLPYGWTHGLSLADRACLTLARRLGVPAVTADRRWDIEGLPVRVQFIR